MTTGTIEKAETESPTMATTEMCAVAFKAVLSTLKRDMQHPNLPSLPECESGVFVTWEVPHGSKDHFSLRGCIGTLSKSSIVSAIPHYALSSALDDPRFLPITMKELPGIRVTVSLLSAFEKASDIYDWEIGVHGLILKFGRYSATYLPEVCKEQEWTKEECIMSLARKAGYRGAFDDDPVWEDASVTRYQSTIARLSYEEYLQMIEES